MELLFRLIHSFPILAVHNEYQTLCAGVVMSPKWPDFVLTTDVPNIEFHVFIGHSFDVEANYKITRVSEIDLDKSKGSRTRWNSGD